MSRFSVVRDYRQRIKRFNMYGRKLEFKIKSVPDNVEPTSWIMKAIQDIVEYAAQDLQPSDQVGITLCGEGFKERGPAWLNFKEAASVKMLDIWELISKIFQSNSTGLRTDTFCLGITSVRLPTGKGNDRARKYNSFDEECAMRRGIVTINNKDNLCLPRALVVAIAAVEKDPDYRKIRKDVGKLQTRRAIELLTKSKHRIPIEGAGIPELKILQELLKDSYKIVVYQYGHKGRNVIFEGHPDGKRLNLIYHEGHFNVITSLTAAFCCNYFCNHCNQPYDHKNKHRCEKTCPCCQQAPVCPSNILNIFCKDCKREFRGQECYEKHLAAGSLDKGSVCEQVKKCFECLKTFNVRKTHICGEIFCKICEINVPQGHACFIQPDKRNLQIKNILYVFYDLETRQEKVIGEKTVEDQVSIGEIKLHEPNLCVFQQRCDQCINKSLNMCEKCGLREHVLKVKPIEIFLEFLLNQRKIFKKVIVIAHNGQAFDHQFLLNHILHQTDIKPELIMRGTKIIMMRLGNVKFLDSLNYFPMSLSQLPKAFDLPSDYKKGYFPHLFNTLENERYIGPLPPTKYYSPNTMKTEDRNTFLNWYEHHRNEEFNMQRDLEKYCKSDVQILTEACLKFRNLMITECSVDPFVEATTIASACSLVFRRNFLKPNTIGIIPKKGYRYADNQSKEAIQWLLWEEDQRKINIQHAANGREAVVNGVKVDGYCNETQQVFEFHGCYYHGHITCLRHNRDDPLYDDPTDTLNRRYEKTISKTDRLRTLGYEVIEMWPCDFDRQLSNDKKMLNYLEHHALLNSTPLKPRDAFYGGRTGNTYSYYKCKPGEKIKYIDVCSLYPWVCKNGKFPIGHPTLYVGHDNCSKLDLQKTDGLIKCKILPPEELQHPVLPLKQNSKLMFSLCRKCSENKNQEEFCPHSNEERALVGTWVIDEVNKALEKDYKLLEIYEIWSYDVKQYNKLTSTDGLFTDMMNKFIKMKQQASGWPSQCSSQEAKAKYIEDFLSIEGVGLEFDQIVNNPGLRSLAKLILNSFWGKFGQEKTRRKPA